LKSLSFANTAAFTAHLLASVSWMPPAHAADSRCPPGMHSPDGNVCVPGESMHDESQAIRNRPYSPLTFRDMQWSAIAMDRKKLLVTDREMTFIGVSRGHKDMKVAQKAALDMCRSDGPGNCELIETVVNACLAISISPEANKLEYAYSADPQFAIDESLRKCRQQYKGCRTAYADCVMK
jgi:hypothetical protein